MAERRFRMERHVHTGRHEIMHWLYDPAALGRKAFRVRFRWLHIHLIPGWLLERSCDKFDRRMEGE